MIDANGRWAPDLAPKGYQVLNDYHRFLLLTGPRRSAKTTCIVSKICRHLWENDGARFAILGKSLRSIKSSGTWQDLIELPTGIKQWINAGIGFEYAVEPKLTGDTKMTYFRIRNMYGGESELQVHSLEHDHQVEEKFKQTRYSGFYMVEADNFRSHDVLTALDDQLRLDCVTEENWQVLLDCNPPEEGEDHWLHQYFFQHVGHTGIPFSETYAEKFGLIQFTLDDNPFLSESEKQHLKDKYIHDPVKYARYVEGKWVKDTGGGIFEDVFSEQVHVVGNVRKPREDDWDVIIPGPHATDLVSGWDPGDVNHAFGILCPREGQENTVFDLIDEVVVIDRKVSLVDFTEAVVEAMDYWEEVLKSMYGHKKIRWRHWADSSATTRYRSGADRYDYQIIREASEGRIQLTPSPKSSGSVKKRIDLVRKLLFQNRIQASAQCRHHLDMLRFLKPGSGRAEPIRRGSPHKHCFDALSYALENEAPADMERRNSATVVKKPKIVSV